jgi:hypothetical protein
MIKTEWPYTSLMQKESSQQIPVRHTGQPAQTALLYDSQNINFACQDKLKTTATNTISPSSCVGWSWPWRDGAQWPYWPAGCGPAHWACSVGLGPLACPPVVTLTDPCQNGCTWPHGRYGSVISQFPLLTDLPSFYNAFQTRGLHCLSISLNGLKLQNHQGSCVLGWDLSNTIWEALPKVTYVYCSFFQPSAENSRQINFLHPTSK